jgi:CheY-like chemotaxis protein
LTIETANVDLDEAYARDRVAVESGPYAMLAVSDSGIGILGETLPHIFEPFFTTKESGKGTGLGLSTVFGIVKQTGGEILVSSAPGHGSIFEVYLPLDRGPISAEAPSALAGALRSPGRETVLVVEDDDAVRGLTRAMLKSLGYDVLAPHGTQEALELTAQHSEPIDLLLTDVVMPGMGGLEVAERVSALRPGIGLLFTSGHSDQAFVQDGTHREGAAFLPKPFTQTSLSLTQGARGSGAETSPRGACRARHELTDAGTAPGSAGGRDLLLYPLGPAPLADPLLPPK